MKDHVSQAPSEELFAQSFKGLSFSITEHGTARYLLELFNREMAPTGEVDVAGSQRVHVEHIYPQNPKANEKWPDHAKYVLRLGNLTLLDKRLNEQIKNSMFPIKKPFYADSQLMVTKALLAFDDWSPQAIEERQVELLALAMKMWPEKLVE